MHAGWKPTKAASPDDLTAQRNGTKPDRVSHPAGAASATAPERTHLQWPPPSGASLVLDSTSLDAGLASTAREEDPVSDEEKQAAAQLLVYVPYSLHCSFPELQSFVAAIKPRVVHGIVSTPMRKGADGQDSRDPVHHLHHLC